MAKKKSALTVSEERFVEEYLIDRNGTAAYIRANPDTKRSTAAEMASRLLKKSNITKALKAGSRELARQCRVSAAREIRGMALLANYDIGAAFDLTRDDWVPLPPRKIPYETRQAIVGFKVTRRRLKAGDDEEYEVESVEYKFADKIAARDKLMRHLGLYKDLPPLEVLLAAIGPDIAEVVRRALAQAVHPGADPGGGGGNGPGSVPPPGSGGGGPGGGPGGGLPPGGLDPGPVAGGVPGRPVDPADDVVLSKIGQNDGRGGEDSDPLFG